MKQRPMKPDPSQFPDLARRWARWKNSPPDHDFDARAFWKKVNDDAWALVEEAHLQGCEGIVVTDDR